MRQADRPSGLELGLGLPSIGPAWGTAQPPPPSRQDAERLIARAMTIGIRSFDTTPAYGPSEEILGRVLQGLDPTRRDAVVINRPLSMGEPAGDPGAASPSVGRPGARALVLTGTSRLDHLKRTAAAFHVSGSL